METSTTQGNDLRLIDLEKEFRAPDGGMVTAVNKISLDVAPGEFVSLLGPSGCGKTTILRMVAGLEQPTRGEIAIGGERVNELPPYKRNIGLVFQSYALFPHKTVFDNVAYSQTLRRRQKDETKASVDEMLALVGLGHLSDRSPAQLSGGQQQRVALARALSLIHAFSCSMSRSQTWMRACACRSAPRSVGFTSACGPQSSMSPTIRVRR